MALCNISSWRGILPSHNSCSSAKLTSLHDLESYLKTALWFYTFQNQKNCALQNACSASKPKTITCTVCATYWGKTHCIAWCLNYITTITCKPHGMPSTLKLTSVSWVLLCGLLKLKAASGMVFATCWNYHLHIAHTAWCLQRAPLKSVNCTALTTLQTNACKLRGACSCFKVTCVNWKVHAASWS